MLLFAPLGPVNNSSAAGSSMGRLGGSSQSGSKFQTVPGQLWLLVAAEVPKTQPHGSVQHRSGHASVQLCWVLWTDTGSRNNDLKESSAQVSSKRLRLKGQDCFHPTKAWFCPNLSQTTHQMKKNGKACCVRQLYFTIHLLQVNKSQAGERN